MHRGRTVLGQSGIVGGRGIALVVVPSVGRVLLMKRIHIVVAIGFGQNGGGGYGEVFPIAFHNGVVGNKGFVVESVAVDKQ